MSSANNTIDAGEEGQAADRERSPAEIAALDKSRSLFGNPSATLVTPRDPTPDAGEGVGMETEGQEPVEPEAEPEHEPEEPMDTSEPVVDEVEEEVFEKKVVSMDTDGEGGEGLEDTTLNDTEDVEALEESPEDVGDEDEEEAPKKKPKRAASTSDDELDDTQEDEEQAEPVEQLPEEHELEEQVEQPEEHELGEPEEPEEQPEEQELAEQPEEPQEEQAEEQLEEQKNGAVESTQEDSDESASLQIDESADKSVEQQSSEDVEEPEEPVEETTPRASRKSTGRRGRSSGAANKRGRRSAAQQEVVEEHDVEEPEAEEVPEAEEAPEDVTPSRRGRGRRSAAAPTAPEVAEASEDVETSGRRGRSSRAAKKVEEAPEEAESPKRGRGRRSAAAPATPRSTRKAKNAEPEEVEEETTSPTRKSTRTPRGRKAKEPEEDVEEAEEETEEAEEDEPEEPEAPTTSSRRSTRAKATPKATATPASKRTPARGRKETEDVETPKRGRGAAKKTPGSSKQDEYDPYDMDTEMEHHPVPLKNIQELQMEVQNFGAVKYAKAGTSEAKYSMTERTAESRLSELQGASASKNRRSLADMTPGKEKVKHRIQTATSSGRKPRAKKEEDEDVEMEEVDERPTSSASATPSNRGKKRKSEASLPSAKKQAQNLIPQIDEEQQLIVDHPSDDNEPYAPGARVYAIFNKMFYPAVIVAERDGLGRYKLQFVADKVVKDVPNSGIIPLRDIVEGKKAYIEDELFFVESGPNDFSAKDWALGQITLRCVDDDDKPTDEQKVVAWTEISFESTEWRDYIKNKEQTATAVVASNITTVSEATRARKPLPAPAPKPSNGRKDKKKNGGGLVESRGASTPREDDENELLPLNEKAVGKNIFAGKVFMLTSANRHTNSHVPAMFRKKNLMEFITQNGGVVTEQLTDFQERYAGQNMLLISDTYYRTHKYLAALANGIPCVHNVWLQKCAEAGEIVPYEPHILPAGASLFDDSDQPAPENPSKLLEDKVLYVHSTHTAREKTQTGPGGTFVEIWSPMLKLLGATIIEDDWEKVLSEEQKYDVVLVDGTFRDEVLEYTRSIGAKAVTSEWVIQTIILGRAPEPDSHPKFDPYRLHHRPRQTP